MLQAQMPLGAGGDGNPRSTTPGDSSKTARLRRSDPAWQSGSELLRGNDTFCQWDSTMPFTHRYNRIRATGQAFVDLGHYASPQRMLSPEQQLLPGLHSGFNPYSIQNKNPDHYRVYRAKIPLTRFSYFQAGGGFVSLDMMHTQNIRPNWNISLDYSSVNNREIYEGSRQDHLHRGTMAGSYYHTNNKRFTNLTVFSWNRARRNENGGIEGDSLFFGDNSISDNGGIKIINRGNYYPRLNSAKSFYGNRKHISESRLNSANHKTYVFHRVEWNRSSFRYSDDNLDTSFYGKQTWLSQDSIQDSSSWNGLNNRIGLGFKAGNQKTSLFLRTAFMHDWLSYYSRNFLSSKDYYFSQGIHADLSVKSEKWNINSSIYGYFNGYNSGDYLISADGNYILSDKLSISAAISTGSVSQGVFFQRFFGNHHRIINSFDKNQILKLNAGLVFKSKYLDINITLNSGSYKNLIYSYADAGFKQSGSVNLTSVQTDFLGKFGKFRTLHRTILQRTSDSRIIAVPTFTTQSAFYFQGHLFKKAMLARFGLDLSYWNSFTAYAYRPDLAWFYIQPDGRKAGNYPFADLFFSGEIKTVIVSLKLEHFNSNIAGYGANNAFISASGYATEPLRFLVGVIWRFHY